MACMLVRQEEPVGLVRQWWQPVGRSMLLVKACCLPAGRLTEGAFMPGSSGVTLCCNVVVPGDIVIFLKSGRCHMYGMAYVHAITWRRSAICWIASTVVLPLYIERASNNAGSMACGMPLAVMETAILGWAWAAVT